MRDNPWIVRSALVIGCCAVVGVSAGCPEGGDGFLTPGGQYVINGCGTHFTPEWPVDYASVTTNLYGTCPFSVVGVTDVIYDATAKFSPSSAVSPGSTIQLAVVNANGNFTTARIEAVWNDGTDSQGNYTADLSGDYYAATSVPMVDPNSGLGVDSVHVTAYFGNAGYQTASVAQVYQEGTPGTWLQAPNSLGPGVEFIANAGVSDPNYLKPVTFQWTVDGQAVENASNELDWYTDDSGPTTIGVTTTDGNGVVHSASHTIQGCPNNEIQC